MLSSFGSPLAHAGGSSDEAEVDFRLGAEAYARGDLRQALAWFLASNRLAPNANVVFNVARCFEDLGQYPDAYRWYFDARASATTEARRLEAEESLARLATKVAVVDVVTEPPGATLYLNRVDLGSVGASPRRLGLDAGQYSLIVELPGYEPVTLPPADYATGARAEVRLDLVRIVGTVNIAEPSGISVRVGDAGGPVACTTPCSVELPPGLQLLHFSADGFRSPPAQVEVVAGEARSVVPVLSPIMGSLVVDADEVGALVEVDGRAVGFAPVVVQVPVGKRAVRVSSQGFEPVVREVDIVEGGEVALTGLALDPLNEVRAVSRLPERLADAPSSVTILSGAELRAFGYPTIYEALRGVRGVALGFDSAYGSVAVRGLGQANDFGNRLLMLSDGATLNDNILYQSFTGYDGRVDLRDVERIEVVRGAGSVLYGTGAVSGVVNMVPRELANEDGRPKAHVAVGTSDNNVARARGGLTLGDSDEGLSASVAGASGQGTSVELTTPGAPTSIDGFDRFVAASTTGRAWSHDLNFQWFYSTRDQTMPTGAYGTRVNDDRTVWSDRRMMLEARFEPKLSDTVTLFTRVFGNTYTFDGAYAYEGLVPALTQIGIEHYFGAWLGAEARVVFEPGPGLRASLGAEGQRSVIANLDGSTNLSSGRQVTYLDEAAPYTNGAAYALFDGDAADWFRYSAGVRVDVWSTFGATVNPRLAAIFQPTERDVLKVMGGRAFRAPSVYERTYNDGGAFQVRSDFDGTQLAPETLLSGEVEYSHDITDDVTGLVSGWASRSSSLIETRPSSAAPDAPVVYRNSATPVQIFGADAEVRREMRRGWMFTGNYGWQLARYADAAAEILPNAPQHLASIKGIAPLASPSTTLATRLSLEAPRRINLASDATTDTAVIADVVLAGKNRGGTLGYNIGLYNLFNWQYSTPVTETFASPVMPQRGRTVMANIEIGR